MKTVVCLLTLCLTGTAFANDFATVIGRRPNMVTVQQQSCSTQEVLVNNNGNEGKVIGGLAGAAIGSTIGGNHKDRLVGGVVGALVGGAIGNEVSKGPVESQQRVVCRIVPTTVQQGELVTFQYMGRTFTQLIQ